MRRPLLTARSLCLRYKAKVELWHKGAFHVCKTSKILFVVFSSPVLRSMRPHRSELPTATKVLVASTMRSLPLKLKQIHNGILRSVYGSSKLEIFCDAKHGDVGEAWEHVRRTSLPMEFRPEYCWTAPCNQPVRRLRRCLHASQVQQMLEFGAEAFPTPNIGLKRP